MQLTGQAAADRTGINATDLNCLNILSFSGQMTADQLALIGGFYRQMAEVLRAHPIRLREAPDGSATEPRLQDDRRPRSARTVRAAPSPHMPCTPPPGGVDAEHRYTPGSGVR
jgi:hypothetical protein